MTVSYRKKNLREPPNVCKSKGMITEKVCVHRLHRLQLVDEDLAKQTAHVSEEAD